MSKVNINQIESADAGNKLPLSNMSGDLEFSALRPQDFTVASNTIAANAQTHADVIAGAAPIISATPPSEPSGLAHNCVLIRKYDDLTRIWMKTTGTWAHVFDIT